MNKLEDTVPKPKQQPVRPPTAFERLADPEADAAPPTPTSLPTVPCAPTAPHSLCPLPPSRDTTSSCANKRSLLSPNANSQKKKALELSKKLEGLKRGDLVRVTYYDTYGYRSRTGILDEALPAFKLLKLRDIAIDFDDIQDIELRGRA